MNFLIRKETMKNKTKIPFLMILITTAIIFLIPNHVVWGGQSFQTVPTLGPSRTTTKTKRITVTQSISKQTPSPKTTETKPKTAPMLLTTTFTVKATQLNFTKTSRPENTGPVTSTNSSLEPESTSVVIIPNVSNEEEQKDQAIQEETTTIPAFVFPLVVVLLFMVIYLSARRLLKNSINEKTNHSNK